MSGIRSIHRNPTVKGSATSASVPFYVDSDDNTPKCIPAGTGTTEVPFVMGASASGSKVAGGTGTFVSGAVVVATGLTSVLSFTAVLIGTGTTATGVSEIDTILVASITTGAVSVQGAYHSGTSAVQLPSVSGTASFYWTAVGQ